jgi:lipoprotein-releasing system permease protein
MRYELFVGLRYLRAKRREAFISLITLIATGGVAIGVMTLNIVLSVMTGFEEDLRDRILIFEPHLVVWSTAGVVSDPATVLQEVREVSGVQRAAPFVYAQLMLSTAQDITGVLVRGIVPDGSSAVDLQPYLQDGDLSLLTDHHAVPLAEGLGATVELPGIVLGKELAKDLGIGVGDTVKAASATARTGGGGILPRTERFVVVARFNAGMPQYDSRLAYISLRDAQKLFNLGNAVTGVEVRVADLYDSTRIAADIARRLGPTYRVRDWMEANHNLFAALKLQKTVYFIVLMLIIVIAAFTILATLIMVVMEKRKDIAVLKSLGATPAGIARIFIFKGLVIGGLGTLLGNLGGYAGCWVLEHYHFIELPQDVFYVSTVPVKMYPEYFLVVTIASLAMCLLATLYPARQGARLGPVDLIRYE